MSARIIVGIDGSDTSRRAFHVAVEQAVWRGGSVTAVHCVQLPFVGGGYEAPVLDPLVLVGHGKTFVDAELERLEAAYPDGFPVLIDSTVEQGHPGAALVSIAQGTDGSGPADLVVLGSRGYGPIRGVMLGSVTTYVVHHLACPLLVIPPQGDRDDATDPNGGVDND